MFAAWLLCWLDASHARADHDGSISGLGNDGSAASEGGASGTASLLRQLWLLLQGRCYSPWMMWLAAALDRAGEQQLACAAAAQGLLPRACSYWGIRGIKSSHASCFESLILQLAESGEILCMHPGPGLLTAYVRYLFCRPCSLGDLDQTLSSRSE